MGPNITNVLQPTPLAIWKGPESFVSKNLACDSRAPVSFRLNFPFDVQVFDGGVLHTFEWCYPNTCAGIPVDRERMPLPVEGTGVKMVLIAHHNNFLTEVDVGVELNVRRQLGSERGLTAIAAIAEGFPVGCRADAEGAPPPPALSVPTPVRRARERRGRGRASE